MLQVLFELSIYICTYIPYKSYNNRYIFYVENVIF